MTKKYYCDVCKKEFDVAEIVNVLNYETDAKKNGFEIKENVEELLKFLKRNYKIYDICLVCLKNVNEFCGGLKNE
jgi:hypothetical protein